MTSEGLQLCYRELARMKHGQHMPAQILHMVAQILQLRCARTAGRLRLQGGLLCYAGCNCVAQGLQFMLQRTCNCAAQGLHFGCTGLRICCQNGHALHAQHMACKHAA